MITAHAMHAASRWGGCRTQINVPCRGGVVTPCRSKQKLTKVHRAACNVASHQVRIHAFELLRRERSPRQSALAEARSKALNLNFQSLEHVYLRPVGDVTISPRRVFACGGARGIE